MSILSGDSQNELLYVAIEDNQNTIRFTDSKAGAVLVLSGILAAFLSAMGKDYFIYLKKLLLSTEDHNVDLVIFWMLLGILIVGSALLTISIYLSLLTIAPKSGPIDSVVYDLPERPLNVFYLSDLEPKVNLFNVFQDKKGYFKLRSTTASLLASMANLSDSSLKTLLIFELQKVSYIREIKLQRVKLSVLFLVASIGAFLALAIVTTIYYLFC